MKRYVQHGGNERGFRDIEFARTIAQALVGGLDSRFQATLVSSPDVIKI